jgi:hypothetical protein
VNRSGWKHLILTQTVLNTAKVQKFLLPNTAGAKQVILEDVIIDVTVPDLVATTLTKAYGSIMLGDQENITPGPGLDNVGTILTVAEEVVSDATPLPVVHASDGPAQREGPFEVPKAQDGDFYVTLYINSVACTAMKSVTGRVDYTIVE